MDKLDQMRKRLSLLQSVAMIQLRKRRQSVNLVTNPTSMWHVSSFYREQPSPSARPLPSQIGSKPVTLIKRMPK